MVFLEKPINYFRNENIHGVLGLGFSDVEGSYSYMFIEQLLKSDVLTGAKAGICFSNTDSYLYLGFHDALNFDQKTTVLRLNNAYKLDIWTTDLFIDNNKMNQDALLTHINIDDPYIYLPDSMMERIERQIIYFLCYRNRSEIIQDLKNRICKDIPKLFGNNGVEINMNQLTLLKEFLPEVTISVADDSRSSKLERRFRDYIRICPGAKNWSEFGEKFDFENSYYYVCSALKRKKTKYEVELGTYFFEENLLIINYEKGLLGVQQIDSCPTGAVEVFEHFIPLGIDILYNISCLMLTAAIIVLSVSKCDNYFHDDYEIIIEEEEENPENNGENNDPSRGE